MTTAHTRGPRYSKGMATVEVPEVPRSRGVEVPADRTAVLVVDMQNDFVSPGGTLQVADAQDTVPTIAGVLERARSAGARVAYTQDWHPPDDPEFAIWPEHVVMGSWGAEIVAELAPREGERVMRKPRYDGFYGTQLDHLLHLWGIRHVVILGTVANICVLHTAGSAALRWFDVTVVEDGVSALTPFDQLATLRQVTFLYGGRVAAARDVAFT